MSEQNLREPVRKGNGRTGRPPGTDRSAAIGKVFGRLTVLAVVVENRRSRFLCRCECGTDRAFDCWPVMHGRSTSCGCQRTDSCRKEHPYAGTPEHQSWRAMRERCSNPKNLRFNRYGGRGITFCARWDRFENFLADMGNKPTPKHSIDRIDNDGNYEPSNCRWATMKEQTRNSTQTTNLTANGETMCLTDWAARAGVSIRTIINRKNRGLSPEAIVLPRSTTKPKSEQRCLPTTK